MMRKPYQYRVRRRRTGGYTLPEAVIGAVITTMVIGACLSIFIAGAGTWVRGAEIIDAETQSRQAVRIISDQLRQAMSGVIDGNGQGITYQIPARDSNGAFVSPPSWDSVTRRIYYSNGSIYLSAQPSGGTAASRVIGRNIILTDPEDGNAAYTIFTAGTGSVVRNIDVKVVTRRTLPNNQVFLGRKKETVYLRNIPRVTQ